MHPIITTRGFIYMLFACFVFSKHTSAEAFATPCTSPRPGTAGRTCHADGVSGYRRTSRSLKKNDSRDQQSSALPATRGGDAQSKRFFRAPLIRELMAEFIGTFLIVQIGTGSVMSAIFTDSLVGLFQIASVWIIAVTVAICTTASISGAHLNPAISLAFALIRPSNNFNWRKVLPYSMAQLAGAMAGSAVNLLLYSGSISAFESANGIVRGASSGLASARAFGEYFA
jgi:Major intrinsic protein